MMLQFQNTHTQMRVNSSSRLIDHQRSYLQDSSHGDKKLGLRIKNSKSLNSLPKSNSKPKSSQLRLRSNSSEEFEHSFANISRERTSSFGNASSGELFSNKSQSQKNRGFTKMAEMPVTSINDQRAGDIPSSTPNPRKDRLPDGTKAHFFNEEIEEGNMVCDRDDSTSTSTSRESLNLEEVGFVIREKMFQMELTVDFDLNKILGIIYEKKDGLTFSILEDLFDINSDTVTVAKYASFRILIAILGE